MCWVRQDCFVLAAPFLLNYLESYGIYQFLKHLQCGKNPLFPFISRSFAGFLYRKGSPGLPCRSAIGTVYGWKQATDFGKEMVP